MKREIIRIVCWSLYLSAVIVALLSVHYYHWVLIIQWRGIYIYKLEDVAWTFAIIVMALYLLYLIVAAPKKKDFSTFLTDGTGND